MVDPPSPLVFDAPPYIDLKPSPYILTPEPFRPSPPLSSPNSSEHPSSRPTAPFSSSPSESLSSSSASSTLFIDLLPHYEISCQKDADTNRDVHSGGSSFSGSSHAASYTQNTVASLEPETDDESDAYMHTSAASSCALASPPPPHLLASITSAPTVLHNPRKRRHSSTNSYISPPPSCKRPKYCDRQRTTSFPAVLETKQEGKRSPDTSIATKEPKYIVLRRASIRKAQTLRSESSFSSEGSVG
jgi:hypothetical protein